MWAIMSASTLYNKLSESIFIRRSHVSEDNTMNRNRNKGGRTSLAGEKGGGKEADEEQGGNHEGVGMGSHVAARSASSAVDASKSKPSERLLLGRGNKVAPGKGGGVGAASKGNSFFSVAERASKSVTAGGGKSFMSWKGPLTRGEMLVRTLKPKPRNPWPTLKPLTQCEPLARYHY
jgi:hypothetical protein